MKSGNLGYFYYKEYYKEYFVNKVNASEEEKKSFFKVQEKNNLFKSVALNEFNKLEIIKRDEFFLKTTYPGLLIGSGLIHSIGAKGESKLGLDFDYTTGLPIIRGSSVKGVLRSIFDLLENDNKKGEVEKYLKGLLKEVNVKQSITKDFLVEVKNETFEGYQNGKSLSMYNRDVFFDANIDFNKNKEKTVILGEDYITRHGQEEEKLKNPIPIKFIKVMPNVVFRFQFDLKDGILKKEQKLNLFKAILLDIGIGAKTNVGYGQFLDVEN